MKKIITIVCSLFLFVLSSNAVVYKGTNGNKKVADIPVSKTKKEASKNSEKSSTKTRQIDCDVTLDLSEECCDGSWYLSFCTTHFCDPSGDIKTDCYSYGDQCPICPPQ